MQLSERQETVLRALVRAYVGEAVPVGSQTLSCTLPLQLSAASIRNSMAELTELGLIDQPLPSAGRVPTLSGLRLFVDDLLDAREVGEWERRLIEHELADAARDVSLQVASQLLGRRARQLGFAVLPRLDRVVLRHVSLVRLSRERVLVVLVSQLGVAYQRVLRDCDSGDQPRLERLAAELNRHAAGHTLPDLRGLLAQRADALRARAGTLAVESLLVALDALAAEAQPDVWIASRTALLEQPEFHDPERVRALLELLDTHERLVAVVDRVLDAPGVAVTFGGEVGVPELRDCAVVSATCGAGESPCGVVGILGPRRMDYARVVPLVDLFSRLVTEKLSS